MKVARVSGRQYVKYQRGFTLVDALVTTGVVGVLAGFALPAFSNLAQSDRSVSQLNSLVVSLNYARTEAVKRNSSLTVCPSANGTNCSGEANWSDGWVVVDSNSEGGAPLMRMPALTGNSTLSVSGSTSSLTFDSTGRVVPMRRTTMTICDARGAAHAREIEVGATGHLTAAEMVGHNVSGGALRCP
jgi:type IV fimbrial biogenesis protein FimT